MLFFQHIFCNKQKDNFFYLLLLVFDSSLAALIYPQFHFHKPANTNPAQKQNAQAAAGAHAHPSVDPITQSSHPHATHSTAVAPSRFNPWPGNIPGHIDTV